MPGEQSTFGSAAAADAGPVVDRAAQTIDKISPPQGLILVSADNHVEITEDIFFDSFPASLRNAAPRVWFDKYWRVGFKGDFEGMPLGPSGNRQAPAQHSVP